MKPQARCFRRVLRGLGGVRPYWHNLMAACELPVTLARRLTIPLLHEGSYRRRMLLLNLPCAAAFGAGVLNAIAGGGSFLTFPALVFAGVPPLAANATSAAAVSPGYLSSREMGDEVGFPRAAAGGVGPLERGGP